MDEFCHLRRNERYGACPDEVYKCAFVTKSIIRHPPPRLVFSNTPVLPYSLHVIQEVLAFVLRHGFQLRHDAFHKAAKQENTVIALLAFLDGQLAVEHLISVFVLL